jgi:Beta-propeller repeat
VVNTLLSLLFTMLFLLGCNSENASLNPISSRSPFITQLGTKTFLPGHNSNDTEQCNDIAVDRFDNIYCVGSTLSNFGYGFLNDTTSDGFVAKFSREGKLLWIRQLASSNGRQELCQSVGVDYNGNVYCGGSTQGLLGTGQILNKNQQGAVLDRTATAIDKDGFVAKLNTNGTVLWIKQFGSYGEDECANIAVSPSGNTYCGSKTTGEIGVDALTNQYEYLGATSLNPLVAKIDTFGNVKWIRQWGALSVPDYVAVDSCSSITIDEDENVYCAGSTQGSIADTNGGATDIFVWVLDKEGFTTTKLQVGVNASSHPDILSVSNNQECYDVVVDKDKNIYCAVYTSAGFAEASGGGADIAVIKWDRNFNIQWVRQLGATTTLNGPNSGSESTQAITITPQGQLILVGSTSSPNFGPIIGSDDAFILAMSTEGQFLWGKNFGTTATDVCVGVAIDSNSNILCGGYTRGSFSEPLNGNYDMFILRANPLGLL